jgi:NosR/NirI family nitrous oxide reductase transcriptional regulator
MTSLTAPAQTALQLRRAHQRTRRHVTSIAAVIVIIGAWLYGYFSSGYDVKQYVPDVLPGAERVVVHRNLYIGYGGNDGQQIVGYAQVGTAAGYGGPVDVLVGIDPDGVVTGAQIIKHHETPGFFRLLGRENFLTQFIGKGYQDTLSSGDAIDAVSGATISSEAVAMGIRQAVREMATDTLKVSVPPEQHSLVIGAPEIVLIALFAVSFVLHRWRQRQFKQYGRWAVLLAGIVLLGFWYNKPLTLANVISLVSAYWPDWHNNLYWFLLLGGVFSVTLIQGKNPYCSWFCPFGGTQELLGTFAGAKTYLPRRIYSHLRWAQRTLAFTAIVLGLALRMPGAASYEPFGTLFSLKGSWPQWGLLALVLLASLIIYRPFCNYVCPVAPVVDFGRDVRSWAKEEWERRSSHTSRKDS